MDDAVISDSKGNKANFRNVVIIMTSNDFPRGELIYGHKQRKKG